MTPLTARQINERRAIGLRRNNVAFFAARAVRLPCGHTTTSLPVAQTRNREWYRCPECKEIITRRKR